MYLKKWSGIVVMVILVAVPLGCWKEPVDTYAAERPFSQETVADSNATVQGQPAAYNRYSSEPAAELKELDWSAELQEFKQTLEAHGKPASSLGNRIKPSRVTKPYRDRLAGRNQPYILYEWSFDHPEMVDTRGIIDCRTEIAVRDDRVEAVSVFMHTMTALAGEFKTPNRGVLVKQVKRLLGLGPERAVRYQRLINLWELYSYYQLGDQVVEIRSVGTLPPVTEETKTDYSTGNQDLVTRKVPDFSTDDYEVTSVYIGPDLEVFTQPYGQPRRGRKFGKALP